MRPIQIASIVTLLLLGSTRLEATCVDGQFNSTFQLIQKAIFERHGCTASFCHAGQYYSGLDLREDTAYHELVDVRASSVYGYSRVVPGDKDRSLLWVNLAAKTLPNDWLAPLRAMPLDPAPALSEDELEAIRLWIVHGAPAEGVVPGTADLLDACAPLPEPKPLEIVPLAPPEVGTGLQFSMPVVHVAAHHEQEVCFAEYYDVRSKVPASALSPDGKRLRYRRSETRQTPMSHHLVMTIYRGSAPLDSSEWGEFHCRGGAHDGERCELNNPELCGSDSHCATAPATSLGCVGFGPSDAGFGVNSLGDGGAQRAADELVLPDGIYDELPVSGIILWNSHAFNLTDTPGDLQAWINFDFASAQQQAIPLRRITNTEAIFTMNAPAFGTDERCHRQVIPPNAHLFSLGSHTHKRGKRFRIFAGAFQCRGGVQDGQPCSPYGPDFVSADMCAGSPCEAWDQAHVGDCDASGAVTVDEIISSVGIALGTMPVTTCPEADGDRNAQVSVDEIITSVDAALSGVPPATPRDPDDSLLYVNLQYDDPLVLRPKPELVFPATATDDERTLTFCSLYDNGFSNPAAVKTRTTSPAPPIQVPGTGGPCATPTGCTAGRVGEACRGRGERVRNSSCDTEEGSGDGFCDACPSVGGVTTEDEMLVLLGQYYVP